MSDTDRPAQQRSGAWRWLRWCVIGLFLPLAIIAVLLCFVLWRLAQSPLDVTALSQRWEPVAVQLTAGQPPVGYVHWGKILLGWSPHRQHIPAGLLLRVEHVNLVQGDGRVLNQLEHVAAVLNLAALLRGHVAFRAVRVSGAQFALKHYEDGTIAPDIIGFPRKSLTSRKKGNSLAFLDADALRDVEISNLSVTMRDAQRADAVMHFHMPALAVHYRRHFGWQGHIEGAFHWGQEDVPFQLNAQSVREGLTHLSLDVHPFVPARLAGWLPQVDAHDVKRWQLPVQLHAEGDVQPKGMGGRPLNLQAEFSLGAGDILQTDHDPLHLQEGHGRFDVRWQGNQPLQHVVLDQGRIRLVMRDGHHQLVPVMLSSHVQIDDMVHPSAVDIAVQARIPAFDFATLGSIWPYGMAKGARRWITANMTEGRGDGLAIDAQLHSATGLKGLSVQRLEGQLKGHALSVSWLRPVQPVTNVEASARFLDPNTLQIDVAHGQLSDGQHATIAVPRGRITLSGILRRHSQFAHIQLGLDGAFPSFLNVLSHPRLHLLSNHPLSLRQPAGKIAGELSVSLPLDKSVKMGDIHFDAQAQCQNITFDSPALGAVKGGKGQLQVTSQAIRFQGKADIRHIPVDVVAEERFQANEPGRVLRSVRAQTALDTVLLRKMGLSLPAGMMSGSAPVTAVYVQKGLGHKHRQGEVQINADFTPVALRVPSWVKPAGVPTSLSAHIRTLDARIQAVTNLRAQGPGLSLVGGAMVKKGRVFGVRVDHMTLGRNVGRLQASWPIGAKEDNTPYHIDVTAESLDVSPWFQAHQSSTGALYPSHPPHRDYAKPLLPSGEWAVSLQSGRVFYRQDKALTDMSATVAWKGRRLEQAVFHAKGPHALSVQLEPDSQEKQSHVLKADIGNLSSLVKELEGYQQLEGGHVHLEGRFTASSPSSNDYGMWGLGLGSFTGHVRVHDLALAHPPAALTAATVFAPLHWGQIERDRFENLAGSATVKMQHTVMTVEDGQLSNAILGATLEGNIDIVAQHLALQGTVSPLFGLNHAAGGLFGMRSFFAPEKGSGVMALTYTLDGTFDKPTFQTYPLSVFLPGMLRHILQ